MSIAMDLLRRVSKDTIPDLGDSSSEPVESKPVFPVRTDLGYATPRRVPLDEANQKAVRYTSLDLTDINLPPPGFSYASTIRRCPLGHQYQDHAFQKNIFNQSDPKPPREQPWFSHSGLTKATSTGRLSHVASVTIKSDNEWPGRCPQHGWMNLSLVLTTNQKKERILEILRPDLGEPEPSRGSSETNVLRYMVPKKKIDAWKRLEENVRPLLKMLGMQKCALAPMQTSPRISQSAAELRATSMPVRTGEQRWGKLRSHMHSLGGMRTEKQKNSRIYSPQYYAYHVNQRPEPWMFKGHRLHAFSTERTGDIEAEMRFCDRPI